MNYQNSITLERKNYIENVMSTLKSVLERKYWVMYFKLGPDSGVREGRINGRSAWSTYTENFNNRIDASFYRQDKYAAYVINESSIGRLQDKKPYTLTIDIIYDYLSADTIKFSCKRNWYDNRNFENDNVKMSESTLNINTADLNINNLVEIFDRCYNHLGEKTLAERRKDELYLDALERRFPSSYY